MKRLLFLIGALLLSTPVFAQAPTRICLQNFITNSCVDISSTNPLPVSATITPSGTQNVNITQILGAAPSLTNPLWITPATGASFSITGSISNTSFAVTQATAANLNATVVGTGTFVTQSVVTNAGTFAVQTTLQAGSAIAGKFGIDQTTAGTTNGVQITAGTALSKASTTALGTSLVIKNAAGSLYGAYTTGITGGAAGYLILYNGTSAPSTGALTGANVLDSCYFSGAAGCSISYIPMPVAYSTGIVALVSSAATPYTYTTGTDTGMIVGTYQ